MIPLPWDPNLYWTAKSTRKVFTLHCRELKPGLTSFSCECITIVSFVLMEGNIFEAGLFRYVAPTGLADGYLHFGANCCLHLQIRIVLLPWRWKHQILPKRIYPYITLHDVTYQTIVRNLHAQCLLQTSQDNPHLLS